MEVLGEDVDTEEIDDEPLDAWLDPPLELTLEPPLDSVVEPALELTLGPPLDSVVDPPLEPALELMLDGDVEPLLSLPLVPLSEALPDSEPPLDSVDEPVLDGGDVLLDSEEDGEEELCDSDPEADVDDHKEPETL